MKPWKQILLATALVSLLSGCSAVDAQQNPIQPKAVRVLNVAQENHTVSLNYIGTVDAKELIKYSFKVNGQIDRYFVKKGDTVTKGTPLVSLDKTDLGFQVSAAKATMDTAELSIKKAQDALNYTNVTLERVKALNRSGAASKDELDQIQLKSDVATSEYSQAKSQYDAARTDYLYKSDLLKNSIILAEQDGVVAEKVFNEKERIGPYTPVIIVRSGAQIVNIGIPQQELSKIAVGSVATVDVDGESAQGTVTNIAEIPDSATRTYTAEINVPSKVFRLGSIARVSITAGTESGIWVPMTALLSDGESYVYVIRDERALRRIVEIESNQGDRALVKGLSVGEKLVISGMNNLDDGTKVKVSN